MNRKGFTLVELIAMMVVIAVLMAIAVPNITGIIKKNRESIGIEDVNKMIGNAKTKIETQKIKAPKLDECVVISLNYLDTNNDFKTGINGGTYDANESVIVVAKKQISGATSKYKYYLRLVETKDGHTYINQNKDGIAKLIYYEDFANDPAKNGPKEVNSYTTFNLSSNTNEQIKNIINGMNPNLCNSVVGVYN